MTPQRESPFDAVDDLDVSGFGTRAAPQQAARPDQVSAISEAAQFQSRDPMPVAVPVVANKREPRRYRTGRNTQLNIKARTEAIEAFYAIADKQGWVLGETFERAVAALRRELAGGQ
jgi:hypothetical protein